MFEAKNNGAFGGELKRPRGFALISKFWQHGNGGRAAEYRLGQIL